MTVMWKTRIDPRRAETYALKVQKPIDAKEVTPMDDMCPVCNHAKHNGSCPECGCEEG